MTKRWMGFGLLAAALTLPTAAAFACDHEAKAADAKPAQDTKVAAQTSDAKGCDMPCCAHAKAVDAKAEVAVNDEKPCAGHDAKGCPKKAAAAAVAAKAEPAKAAAEPQPASGAGTQR